MPHTFTIRVTASRLAKGLLAIPRKITHLFPAKPCQIQVVFDDALKLHQRTFLPYDRKVKECRIFGLGRWYVKRQIKAGEQITITVEDQQKRIYRISLDRFVRRRREMVAERQLQSAPNEETARRILNELAEIRRIPPRQAAQQELLRLAEGPFDVRPRVIQPRTERREAVAAALRVLLTSLHGGLCQVCSFTFKKENGELYFEIHHLDQRCGHHPKNLLVLCPNCHAQFEHASVTDHQWVQGWLISVKINGRHVVLRQPLAREPLTSSMAGARILLTAMHLTLLALQRLMC